MFLISKKLIMGFILSTGCWAAAASYQISPMNSGLCLSVYGGSGADNTAIIQWSCAKAGDQIFSLVNLTASTFKLVAQHSNKCIEVKNSSTANGAALVQATCNTSRKGQSFTRVALSNGAYTIKTNAGFCFDVPNGSKNNGTAIVQWGCNGGNNQQFKFIDTAVVTPPVVTPPVTPPVVTPPVVTPPVVTPPVTPPAASIPNPASATAKVELRIVHSATDLYKRGCDVWKPNTEACRSASNQYCVSRGYVGGYGPVDVSTTTSTVTCFGTTAADAKTFSYSGSCASSNSSSIACQALAQQSCLSAGYAGSSGVVASSTSGFSTVCIKAAAGTTANVDYGSLSTLKSASSANTCDAASIAAGNGCVANAHKFCASKGYNTGFLVNSFNSSTQGGSVVCTKATSVTTELFSDNAYGGYSRAAVLGTTMTVGGPTSAGDTTHPDRIRNNFSYPIVMTYAAPSTSYVAPSGGNYSLDTSIFLNHGTFYPGTANNESFDGEIISVYSSMPTVPNINFGAYKKGLLILPGETVGYQGAAKWGTGGAGLYNIGAMEFHAVSEGYQGMGRIRFPRVDSSFRAGLVPAGCDANCSTQPVDSYVGFPNTASNYWYTAKTAMTIGGMQIFTNSPIKSGRVRVVNSAGQDVVTPYSFKVSGVSASFTNAQVLGPEAFNASFGAAQNGSSFVSLNIAVPAGSRVGVEWDLQWQGDFAGFLYFNR